MIVFVLKAQYEFIHHALGELVVCGETEVTASNLKSFTQQHTGKHWSFNGQKAIY